MAVGVATSASGVRVAVGCSGAGAGYASQTPAARPARMPSDMIAIFERASTLTMTILCHAVATIALEPQSTMNNDCPSVG